MEIVIKDITKKYEDVIAVDGVSLQIKEGELIALLGPSGCGKTTLLRVIAGLIPNDTGRIFFNNIDISNWPAQKRNAVMVFQNYALFPHLSVEQNIAYGLKVRKLSQKEISNRVKSVLERVELKGFEKRRIQELSGGQKQRVALARALVVKPSVLLFDEPLSNLDEKLRISMRQEIKKILKETGITSIYVTHDQGEALAIADRIVVMNKGRIQQFATPNELYFSPQNSFVASFVGQANLINLTIEKREGNKAIAQLLERRIKLDIKDEFEKNEIIVLLRPEELRISDKGIKGTVKWKENLGMINRYKVDVLGIELTVDELNRRNCTPIEQGQEVYVDFNEEAIHVLYE